MTGTIGELSTESIRSAILGKIRGGQLGVDVPGVPRGGTIVISIGEDTPMMAQQVRDAIATLERPPSLTSTPITRAESAVVHRIEVIAGRRIYAYDRVGHLRYVEAP
jgi:hypothetical protein